MKLEELPGVLDELKKQLLVSLVDEVAPEANEALLSELRKRIMQDTKKSSSSSKTTLKAGRLNEQQAKFLKTAPQLKTNVNPDAIELERKGDTYSIGIDSTLPKYTKELAKVTDGDVQQYHNTINEEAKNQLKNLL